jgi:death-on-curing protein
MTASVEPVWIEKLALVVLHDRTLALPGGPVGVRDERLLESALQRLINRFHYENETSLAALAGPMSLGSHQTIRSWMATSVQPIRP